jgi:hypothetical protein
MNEVVADRVRTRTLVHTVQTTVIGSIGLYSDQQSYPGRLNRSVVRIIVWRQGVWQPSEIRLRTSRSLSQAQDPFCTNVG